MELDRTAAEIRVSRQEDSLEEDDNDDVTFDKPVLGLTANAICKSAGCCQGGGVGICRGRGRINEGHNRDVSGRVHLQHRCPINVVHAERRSFRTGPFQSGLPGQHFSLQLDILDCEGANVDSGNVAVDKLCACLCADVIGKPADASGGQSIFISQAACDRIYDEDPFRRVDWSSPVVKRRSVDCVFLHCDV